MWVNNPNFDIKKRRNKKMASDCTFAGDKNSQGQMWCKKKNIYVTGLEKDSCSDYEKV